MVASQSSESCASDRRPCSCDLSLGIAVNTKDIVVLRFRRLARWTKVGVHILPNDFTVRCHLKKASKPSIIDKGIPIGQALSVGNAGTEEVRRDSLFVLPHDLTCPGIYFDDPRKGKALIQTVRTVVKDQDVAVRQRCGRVLA